MEKIKQILTSAGTTGMNLPEVMARAFNDQYSRQALNSGALAIKTASSPLAKTVNVITAVINGVLVQKAAADCPALTGYNLTANQFGLVIITLDAAGNFTNYYGTPSTVLGNVTIPPVPAVSPNNQPQCPIGVLVLANGASAFTGNTTALDAITTTYINIVGPDVPTSMF